MRVAGEVFSRARRLGGRKMRENVFRVWHGKFWVWNWIWILFLFLSGNSFPVWLSLYVLYSIELGDHAI